MEIIRKRTLSIGILAHVDAGKTTLSEALLYLSGKIRKPGRVDHKDAYLDTSPLEKERGITIFSKQAIIDLADTRITLLDTPGHVDFSAEMERTLQVLDLCSLGDKWSGRGSGPYSDSLEASGALPDSHLPFCEQNGPEWHGS